MAELLAAADEEDSCDDDSRGMSDTSLGDEDIGDEDIGDEDDDLDALANMVDELAGQVTQLI